MELQLHEFRQELNQLKDLQRETTETDTKTEEFAQKAAVETLLPKENDYQQVNFISVKQQPETSLEISSSDTLGTEDRGPRVEDWAPKTEEVAVDFTDPGFKQIKTTAIGKLFQFIWNWFTDGNTFVRVGL